MGPEEIQQILGMLAEKLGPMATEIWAIYLRQVYIRIAQNIGAGLLMAALGYICWRFSNSCEIKAEVQGAAKNRYGADDWMVGYYSGRGTAIVCWIGAILILMTNLSQLLNPEFAAIRLLLR